MIHSFRKLQTIECTKIGTFQDRAQDDWYFKEDWRRWFHSWRAQFIYFAYLHENVMVCQCWHMYLIKYSSYFTKKKIGKISYHIYQFFLLFEKFTLIHTLRDALVGYITLCNVLGIEWCIQNWDVIYQDILECSRNQSATYQNIERCIRTRDPIY